ncbi:D-2-hydroxyacid dehydrogenase [Enorma burkinafasonensis]|uniref:D-2-hydroxyacid dehydrogenase n=1 Tax=Enorma burkinafasonensis TaxID=2590867 RepID=UPI0026F1216A|nr:D-2-hydroxyacid dehydrogenase [Enorma burkinafasonensis]MCI7729868.1 D-2-hydroxyacid dehydrogenase [Enorma burkinafasonensis]
MNILVIPPFSAAQKAVLEVGAPGAAFTYAEACDVSDKQVAVADVIVGNLPAEQLAQARRLRLLQLNSAGYDAYMAPGTVPAGAALASAVGAYGQAVSEHLYTMLLMLMKHLDGYRDDQRAHAWTDRGAVATLAGAQVLVLGAGDIGRHFAQLASAHGAHVTGVRRHAGTAPQGFERISTMDELHGLLPKADAVVSILPSAPGTRGLVDARFLSSCKRGAYFVNGGRGDLVVQADLIAALESGQLAGAALDVTVPEPLPANDPLWDAPNILITPHVAGQFHLYTVLDNIARIAGENLRRLAAGEPLLNEVALP